MGGFWSEGDDVEDSVLIGNEANFDDGVVAFLSKLGDQVAPWSAVIRLAVDERGEGFRGSDNERCPIEVEGHSAFHISTYFNFVVFLKGCVVGVDEGFEALDGFPRVYGSGVEADEGAFS